MEHVKGTLPFEMDYQPLLLDYDFINSRPRGGSACIDFFSLGKLDAAVADIPDGIVCLAKKGVDPEGGFFLADFSRVSQNAAALIENIKGLNIKTLYVENSRRFPLDGALNNISETAVIFVDFES